jgi:hypothetical protein
MEEELQKLYNSEINVQISCFWDGGWSVALGDNMNGYKKPDFDTCEISEIIPTLQELAKKHYPNSKYVQDLLT